MYNLYIVKDTVTGRFGQIQIFTNEAEAKRWFIQLCAQNENIKGDLQLFYVGEYSVETGVITSVDPTFIVGGAE